MPECPLAEPVGAAAGSVDPAADDLLLVLLHPFSLFFSLLFLQTTRDQTTMHEHMKQGARL